MKKIVIMFSLLVAVILTSSTYAVNLTEKVSFTTKGNMEEVDPFVFNDILELSDLLDIDGVAYDITNVLYFYIGGQLQNMQTLAYINDGVEEYFIFVNELSQSITLRSNNVLEVVPGMWFENDTLVEVMFDGYDDNGGGGDTNINDMGGIIREIVNFFVAPINDSLLYLGVDISLIPITVGFYEAWFNVTLYDLLLISMSVFVWLFMIRLIWKIFKGIFRRVKTW